MSTLVTGGAGFIGSYLVTALLGRGERVTVLDDLSTGRRLNLPDDPRLRIVEGSVCDEVVVRELVDAHEVVFHFAAAVGVGLVRERPVEALATNVTGTDVVIRAAAARQRRLVFASSSEVYGDLPGQCVEDGPFALDRSDELRTGYASAKLHGECAAFAHARAEGLRVLVVRIFNTVGPRQRARYGMVLPRLVAQALAGEPLTVFGDGLQSRCFSHVEDVVAVVLALVDRDCFGSVFNVGSDRQTTIRELAECVRQHVGGASVIEHVPFESVHPRFSPGPRHRQPSLDRLREALGPVPFRRLDAIIAEVVAARRGLGAAQVARG